MKINLVTHNNGVGLTQDVAVMTDVLRGHDCTFVEIWGGRDCPRADVNIFFELLQPRLYPMAKVNLYFPNPEWFMFPRHLAGLDLVCCKTRDCERIFREMGQRVLYTSFTSRDMAIPGVGFQDKRRAFLHLAGKSETKGSRATYDAWLKNPAWPDLYFFKSAPNEQYLRLPGAANIKACYDRVDQGLIENALNIMLFHICCSLYEGFGHYIWEGKSAGAIILTTDGPPMNDFVTPADGLLVPVKSRGRQHLGTLQYIDAAGLAQAVELALALDEDTLAQMSAASRAAWQSNDQFHREIMQKLIGSL